MQGVQTALQLSSPAGYVTITFAIAAQLRGVNLLLLAHPHDMPTLTLGAPCRPC